MIKESLIDPVTGIFNREKHEGEYLESVAKIDINYLLFLYEDSEIRDEDRQVIDDFFEDNPDLLPEL